MLKYMSKLKVAIAVVGISNSGKSTTLFDVATILENQGFPVSPSMTVNKKIDTRRIVVIDGVTIAICPPGDNPTIVDLDYDFAVKNKAEIIVYAQRTTGKVFETVSKRQHNENFWLVIKWKEHLKTNKQAGFNMANKAFANQLIAQIKKMANNIGNLSVFPY